LGAPHRPIDLPAGSQ